MRDKVKGEAYPKDELDTTYLSSKLGQVAINIMTQVKHSYNTME
jgi:hypothetical protein